LLKNLIDNALKYGKSGTAVTVEIAWPVNPPPSFPQGGGKGEVLAIAVTDQGEGIAREHLSRLTERFYRIEGQRARAVTGTGLGLAIVKHIVTRHRGALAIESELGHGSTFRVFLPTSRSASAPSALPSAAPPPGPAAKRKA
jgi:two-component system, OmpR family, phosphate regulon sensor histidine kinase PhoR